MSEKKSGYQPTAEDTQLAEEQMTKYQKQLSDQREELVSKFGGEAIKAVSRVEWVKGPRVNGDWKADINGHRVAIYGNDNKLSPILVREQLYKNLDNAQPGDLEFCVDDNYWLGGKPLQVFLKKYWPALKEQIKQADHGDYGVSLEENAQRDLASMPKIKEKTAEEEARDKVVEKQKKMEKILSDLGLQE